jgi:hypothetical protein
MNRTYELSIERTVVDTYVVEARSHTEASMAVSALMLGQSPASSIEIRRKVNTPVVVEKTLPLDGTDRDRGDGTIGAF